MNALNDSVQAIFDAYASMGLAKRKVADFILANPIEISYLSLKELAENAGVSEVSVLSFCRLMGYKNFVDFRAAFRQQLKDSLSLKRNFSHTLVGNEAVDLLLRQFMWIQSDNFENSVLRADSSLLQRAAKLLLKAEQVYVLGHDASKIPADYLSHRLNFMKIRAWAIQIGSTDSVQAMLAKLSCKDIVIFVSLAPYHLPSREIASFIRKKGADIFVITDSLDSPVVSKDSYNFLCRAKAPLILNTMSSPISVIELMAAAVAVELGDKLSEFIKEFEEVNDYLCKNHENREMSYDNNTEKR